MLDRPSEYMPELEKQKLFVLISEPLAFVRVSEIISVLYDNVSWWLIHIYTLCGHSYIACATKLVNGSP